MRAYIAAVLILVSLMHKPLSGQLAPDQQLSLDIQRSLFAEQYERLLAGEREVLLLVSEASTPISRGVAVLISESGRGPLDPQGLASLSSLLNRYGWVTMQMPAPTVGFMQTSAEQGQPAANTDVPQPPHARQGLPVMNSSAFEQHEQQLMLQLSAVVERSNDYQGYFLVIAQGTSAAWLSRLYAQKRLDLPDALVVVSPYWPQYEYNQSLPALIAKTEMPVLDIYSPWDNEWSLHTYAQRKLAAEKGLKLHYRQRELIGQVMDAEQYQLLSKEIYGWLSHMGW